MSRSIPVGVGILVIVVVLAGISLPVAMAGAVGGSQQAPAGNEHASTAHAVEEYDSQDFDSTTFEITVHENGSATWTFRHEQRLEDDDDETNFEAFAEEFEAEETGLYERFTEQAEALTDTRAEATDREMEATAFNRSATTEYRPGAIGVIEMSFVWEGFAEHQEDRLVVGDVFQNLYLSDDQSLVIEPGGDLVFTAAEPAGEYAGTTMENASSMTWSGEREFVDGYPSAVLRDADDVGSGDTAGTTGWSTGNALFSWPVLVGATVVVLGAAIALVWYREQDGTSSAETAPTEASEPIGPQPASEDADSTDSEAETDAPSEALTEDELLTDEDRVIRLIRENGGRMKQVNIVEETGWSKSKVSMLLSEMEREGSISKLRVGRENIISLEGYEPEAAKSPFDE
ncbi:helix-turn-helix transcriptional regulator [Natronococcus occultus]|uniref:Transcriptional regulator, IclR family n=1 Tax=Natronococcus occultus SP4 TaxID=694430 RepID=L0K0C1_9EURY|nr:helix-turn-helix domain-containing protein [Natronococcus occultus]AGB37573.1 transcriptional regulator, IclR family [Natronococcus occultus SP4]